MDDSGLHGGFDWENAEDVTALSEEDLRDTLEALSRRRSVRSVTGAGSCRGG
jgi:hypothetical protein